MLAAGVEVREKASVCARETGRLSEGDGASSLLLLCIKKAGERGLGLGDSHGGESVFRLRGRSLEKGVQWEGNEGLRNGGILGCLVHGGWAVWDDVVDGYPGREWDDDA